MRQERKILRGETMMEKAPNKRLISVYLVLESDQLRELLSADSGHIVAKSQCYPRKGLQNKAKRRTFERKFNWKLVLGKENLKDFVRSSWRKLRYMPDEKRREVIRATIVSLGVQEFGTRKKKLIDRRARSTIRNELYKIRREKNGRL